MLDTSSRSLARARDQVRTADASTAHHPHKYTSRQHTGKHAKHRTHRPVEEVVEEVEGVEEVEEVEGDVDNVDSEVEPIIEIEDVYDVDFIEDSEQPIDIEDIVLEAHPSSMQDLSNSIDIYNGEYDTSIDADSIILSPALPDRKSPSDYSAYDTGEYSLDSAVIDTINEIKNGIDYEGANLTLDSADTYEEELYVDSDPEVDAQPVEVEVVDAAQNVSEITISEKDHSTPNKSHKRISEKRKDSGSSSTSMSATSSNGLSLGDKKAAQYVADTLLPPYSDGTTSRGVRGHATHSRGHLSHTGHLEVYDYQNLYKDHSAKTAVRSGATHTLHTATSGSKAAALDLSADAQHAPQALNESRHIEGSSQMSGFAICMTVACSMELMLLIGLVYLYLRKRREAYSFVTKKSKHITAGNGQVVRLPETNYTSIINPDGLFVESDDCHEGFTPKNSTPVNITPTSRRPGTRVRPRRGSVAEMKDYAEGGAGAAGISAIHLGSPREAIGSINSDSSLTADNSVGSDSKYFNVASMSSDLREDMGGDTYRLLDASSEASNGIALQ